MKTNREAILETALEIVAFEGIGEMTLSNLAERLGVQKSAIYHWYKSKREIIEDIFETGHRNLMAHSFQLSLEGESKEILKRAASSWIDIFSSEKTSLFLRSIISMHLSDDRAKREYDALSLMLYSHAEVLLERISIKEKKELPAILPLLFSSLLMEFLNSLLQEEERDLNALIEDFYRLIERL